MPDMGKVIKGLECAIDENHGNFKNCHSCSYRKDIDHLQYVCDGDKCIADALDLLKAQKPIKPILRTLEEHDGHESKWYECGVCNLPIYVADKYCRHCGRAVNWND